ncbi:uncharacterized protein VTP21DRAFT_700 [Calcarisporiella thermophila]|uniref:uncharacterized protein n=1 Tax=Calcarisporiella thermophila TaxID=911321 RepID=UPI0037434D45
MGRQGKSSHSNPSMRNETRSKHRRHPSLIAATTPDPPIAPDIPPNSGHAPPIPDAKFELRVNTQPFSRANSSPKPADAHYSRSSTPDKSHPNPPQPLPPHAATNIRQLDHLISLERYLKHNDYRESLQLHTNILGLTLSARLYHAMDDAHDYLHELFRAQGRAEFAAFYNHFFDTADAVLDRALVHPQPKPSFLDVMSFSGSAAVVRFLTCLRNEPASIAAALQALTEEELTTLVPSLAPDNSDAASYGSKRASIVHIDRTRGMVNHYDPARVLTSVLFGPSVFAAEEQLRFNLWKQIFSSLMLERKGEAFVLHALDAYVHLTPLPGRQQLEHQLIKILRRGERTHHSPSSLEEASAIRPREEKAFRVTTIREHESTHPHRTPPANPASQAPRDSSCCEHFFDSACLDLLGDVEQFTPECVPRFCRALLEELPTELQYYVRHVIIVKYFFGQFLAKAITSPEAYGLLDDQYFITESQRQRVLVAAHQRLMRHVVDVLDGNTEWLRKPVNALVQRIHAKIKGFITKFCEPSPHPSDTDHPNSRPPDLVGSISANSSAENPYPAPDLHPKVSPTLLLSPADVLSLFYLIWPKARSITSYASVMDTDSLAPRRSSRSSTRSVSPRRSGSPIDPQNTSRASPPTSVSSTNSPALSRSSSTNSLANMAVDGGGQAAWSASGSPGATASIATGGGLDETMYSQLVKAVLEIRRRVPTLSPSAVTTAHAASEPWALLYISHDGQELCLADPCMSVTETTTSSVSSPRLMSVTTPVIAAWRSGSLRSSLILGSSSPVVDQEEEEYEGMDEEQLSGASDDGRSMISIEDDLDEDDRKIGRAIFRILREFDIPAITGALGGGGPRASIGGGGAMGGTNPLAPTSSMNDLAAGLGVLMMSDSPPAHSSPLGWPSSFGNIGGMASSCLPVFPSAASQQQQHHHHQLQNSQEDPLSLPKLLSTAIRLARAKGDHAAALTYHYALTLLHQKSAAYRQQHPEVERASHAGKKGPCPGTETPQGGAASVTRSEGEDAEDPYVARLLLRLARPLTRRIQNRQHRAQQRTQWSLYTHEYYIRLVQAINLKRRIFENLRLRMHYTSKRAAQSKQWDRLREVVRGVLGWEPKVCAPPGSAGTHAERGEEGADGKNGHPSHMGSATATESPGAVTRLFRRRPSISIRVGISRQNSVHGDSSPATHKPSSSSSTSSSTSSSGEHSTDSRQSRSRPSRPLDPTQVEQVTRWLSETGVQNFIPGDERLHYFFFELDQLRRILMRDLWSEPLFARESRAFGITSVPIPTSPSSTTAGALAHALFGRGEQAPTNGANTGGIGGASGLGGSVQHSGACAVLSAPLDGPVGVGSSGGNLGGSVSAMGGGFGGGGNLAASIGPGIGDEYMSTHHTTQQHRRSFIYQPSASMASISDYPVAASLPAGMAMNASSSSSPNAVYTDSPGSLGMNANGNGTSSHQRQQQADEFTLSTQLKFVGLLLSEFGAGVLLADCCEADQWFEEFMENDWRQVSSSILSERPASKEDGLGSEDGEDWDGWSKRLSRRPPQEEGDKNHAPPKSSQAPTAGQQRKPSGSSSSMHSYSSRQNITQPISALQQVQAALVSRQRENSVPSPNALPSQSKDTQRPCSSAPSTADSCAADYPVVKSLRNLTLQFSLLPSPYQKLRVLLALEMLIIASLSFGPSSCLDNAGEASPSAGRSASPSPLSPSSSSISSSSGAPGTDSIVNEIERVFRSPYLRPQNLMLNLQLIATFVPGSILDLKDEGKAFWDVCLAVMSLKKEMLERVVERGVSCVEGGGSSGGPTKKSPSSNGSRKTNGSDKPTSRGSMRGVREREDEEKRLQMEAVRLFSIGKSKHPRRAGVRWLTPNANVFPFHFPVAAKENHPVAQRELGILYLSLPWLPHTACPPISLPPRKKARDSASSFTSIASASGVIVAPSYNPSASLHDSLAPSHQNLCASCGSGVVGVVGDESDLAKFNPSNISAAIRWFTLAAAQGDEFARRFLKRYREDPSGFYS